MSRGTSATAQGDGSRVLEDCTLRTNYKDFLLHSSMHYTQRRNARVGYSAKLCNFGYKKQPPLSCTVETVRSVCISKDSFILILLVLYPWIH